METLRTMKRALVEIIYDFELKIKDLGKKCRF
jgi:hypothetical protein